MLEREAVYEAPTQNPFGVIAFGPRPLKIPPCPANLSGGRFVRFTSVHPFVGAAERTHGVFDLSDQFEGETSLLTTRPAAERTVFANAGKQPVEPGGRLAATERMLWRKGWRHGRRHPNRSRTVRSAASSSNVAAFCIASARDMGEWQMPQTLTTP